MKNNRMIFYIENKMDNFVPWIFGTTLFTVSFFTNHNLYYSYLYFYTVGLISFALSFVKYSILTEESLIIFYGLFFNRKKIIINKNSIDNIKIDTYKKRIYSGARFGAIPGEFELKCINISLHSKIELNIRNDIIKQNDRQLNDEIELISNGKSIFLQKPPRDGFEFFVENLNFYIADNFKYNNIKARPPFLWGAANFLSIIVAFFNL